MPKHPAPHGTILAFDIGTSSLRTGLFNTQGVLLKNSLSQQAYKLKVAPDGTAELSPAKLLQAARNCLHRTLQFHRDTHAAPILAVSMSTFGHSILGLSKDGTATTPIYTWADSRCSPQAQWLRENLNERNIHRRTGCMLRASFWPAKLLWLQKHLKKDFSRIDTWISPAEWIIKAFCATFSQSVSMASGTGIYNPHRLNWDSELLELTGIKESQLAPFTETSLQLKNSLHRKYPELKHALWIPSLFDGAASNLGSRAAGDKIAAVNVGTSAALRVVLKESKMKVPFGLFCYRVDKNRYLVGGAVSNAGNVRAWCLDRLNISQENQLEKLLAQRPSPDHGLTVLPHLLAERAPSWCEHIPGGIIGITQATSPLDILQASTEAVYHRMAQIADLIPVKNNRSLKLMTAGGIQASPQSLQRLADVMNRTVIPCSEKEASLKGAAIYALETLKIPLPPTHNHPPIKSRPKNAKSFAIMRERQIKLEKNMNQWIRQTSHPAK